MKLKSLLLGLCVTVCSTAFAANTHMHPKADAKATAEASRSAAQNTRFPGYCEIEIINDSFTDVNVMGTFDDYSTVNFNIYRYELPHYVSLFYYNYCHAGMYVSINNGFYTLFSGWVGVNSTVRVIPYLRDQAKAEIVAH